jgi:hypothetical protein
VEVADDDAHDEAAAVARDGKEGRGGEVEEEEGDESFHCFVFWAGRVPLLWSRM